MKTELLNNEITVRMSDLTESEKGVVKSLNLTGSIRRRLQDAGLINGTVVECLHIGFGGKIKAYRIRGGVTAFRKEDAENVLLTKL